MYVEQTKIVPGETMPVLTLLCQLPSGHLAPLPTTGFVRERRNRKTSLSYGVSDNRTIEKVIMISTITFE